ncbi:paraquat-inducible protein A [Paenirhodobacter sp. CAU 1674]|uniref:paraquat-inducible protein A n=1 Tax=Paenirhodobacter sp. CAU 1674 TaxID=3032596 RepID=UPI0023D9BD9E|nr:paraquat-inducible protein A [Paenirhodobacter sp. CAU 1674]MDF2142728.1 paraquat-inducible protein A [Paenirhodobacter sp. CAU 1674]
MLKYANLSLLVLFPVAWFAPLLRAGLLPFFDLDAISVVTGLQALWAKDIFLALLVTVFALIAPMAKVAGVALVQFDLASPRLLPPVQALGRLAMADIFLIALYIVLAKGVGVGRIETGWGLYLFSFCVLASLALSHLAQRRSRAQGALPPDPRDI